MGWLKPSSLIEGYVGITVAETVKRRVEIFVPVQLSNDVVTWEIK